MVRSTSRLARVSCIPPSTTSFLVQAVNGRQVSGTRPRSSERPLMSRSPVRGWGADGLRCKEVVVPVAQAAFAGDAFERGAAQRLAVGCERLGQTAVRQSGEARDAHVDLAVHEPLLVTDRVSVGGDDAEAGGFKVRDGPFGRVLAVRALAGEQQAGVAPAADLPHQPTGGIDGLNGNVRFEPDHVEPAPDQRPQASKEARLEVGREPLDRSEQVVGQHGVVTLAAEQLRVGPVADDNTVLWPPHRLGCIANLDRVSLGPADSGPAIGQKRGDPADRIGPGSCVEEGAPGHIFLELLDAAEQARRLAWCCLAHRCTAQNSVRTPNTKLRPRSGEAFLTNEAWLNASSFARFVPRTNSSAPLVGPSSIL